MAGQVTALRREEGAAAAAEVFVGRAAETTAFLRLLDQARDGRSAVAFVSGEPGIGKSALLRRFASLAEAQGLPVSRDWLAERSATDTRTWHFEPRVASGTPAVWIVDDVHAASRKELDSLLAAVQQTVVSPLVIVAAYREVEAYRTERLRLFLARVAHDFSVIRFALEGLTLDEVREYVSAAVATPVRDPDAALMVFERTDGNPFLVRELASLLGGRPETQLSELVNVVPDGVRDVVRSRLERLDAGIRDILETAAVAGFDIDVRVLATVFDASGRDLLDVLTEAEDGGFVQKPSGRSSYRFVHHLTRDALLDGLRYGDSVRRHLAVGLAVERVYSAQLEPHAGELARHFVQVAPVLPEYAPRAASYSWLAGCASAERGRWEDAAVHYEAAAEFAVDGGADSTQADRVECLLAAGRCWEEAGHARRAWHQFMLAAAECRRAGQRRRFAETVLTALRNIDVPRHRRVDLADEALSYTREIDEVLTARLLAERAADDDTPDAESAATEARDLAERLDLEDVGRRLAKRELVHALSRGDLTAVHAELAAAYRDERRASDPRLRASDILRRAEAEVRAGTFTIGRAAAEEALAFATKQHVGSVVGRARFVLASIALAQGQLDEFEGLSRRLWDRPIERQLLVKHAELLGDLETAWALIPSHSAPGADHPRVQWDLAGTRARIALRSGDREAAARHFAEWCQRRSESYHPLDKHDAISAAAEALVSLGSDETIIDVLDESAACPNIVFSHLTATGLDRLRGLLALRLGHVDQAQRWLTHAGEWARANRAVVEVWLTERAVAEALMLSGEADRAIRVARDAARAASASGFEGVARWISEWADVASGSPRPAPTLVSLTPREDEILRLVAEGFTNHRIATMLNISPHTANRHLSNILAKLSAGNRMEAVRRATHLGLL